MSGVFHHPDNTYGTGPIRCWWFMKREVGKPQDWSRHGGTYVVDFDNHAVPPYGAVMNDFGDLVPVRRPA